MEDTEGNLPSQEDCLANEIQTPLAMSILLVHLTRAVPEVARGTMLPGMHGVAHSSSGFLACMRTRRSAGLHACGSTGNWKSWSDRAMTS